MKLLQIIIISQQLITIFDFFSLKPLHCKDKFVSENFFIGERLKCVLVYWKKQTDRHSNTEIKVAGDAYEKIGHIPNGLFMVVAPALKKEIVLSVEAKVTGHLRDVAEGKWTLEGRIEVACLYEFYCPKKSKAKFKK